MTEPNDQAPVSQDRSQEFLQAIRDGKAAEPTLDTTTGAHAEGEHENITDLPAPRDNRGGDEDGDDGR